MTDAPVETGFFVLVKDGLVCHDFFNFDIYDHECNLKVIESFMEWLKVSAIVGEKEWLEDDSEDKCGLAEWLASDDPFKNSPEKCGRVKNYLNCFSILPATLRLKDACMDWQSPYPPIPCKLTEAGIADLDVDLLRRRSLMAVNAVKIMEIMEVEGYRAALDFVIFLEETSSDVALASKLGVTHEEVSAISHKGEFKAFFRKNYPEAYEEYMIFKFDALEDESL